MGPLVDLVGGGPPLYIYIQLMLILLLILILILTVALLLLMFRYRVVLLSLLLLLLHNVYNVYRGHNIKLWPFLYTQIEEKERKLV